MASPSEIEIQDQLRRVVKYLDEVRLFGNVTATNNIVSLEDAITQNMESDFADQTLNAIASDRARFASILDDAATLMFPGLLTYAKLMNLPDSDAQTIIDRLYDRFIANSLFVKSRNFTFGSPAAGSNAGNGVVLRLTANKDGYDLEAQHADAKTATCITDQNSGVNKHEEVFTLRDGSRGRDVLEMESGGNATKTIAALSANQSLLSNTSFSSFTPAAANALWPTDIGDWTSSVAILGTGADYTMDQTNYYRDSIGDTTPTALNIKLTRTVSQKLSVNNTRLDPNTPYMLQVAYNRAVGGATGTLTIEMGNKTTSVALVAQAGWNLLRMPLTPGANCWFPNFNEQDPDVKITFTSTGGALLVDDVLLVPATPFDGSWYWFVGGSTPFLRDDSFTWTDSATESKIQRWFWRAFQRSLPSKKDGTETWVDPV